MQSEETQDGMRIEITSGEFCGYTGVIEGFEQRMVIVRMDDDNTVCPFHFYEIKPLRKPSHDNDWLDPNDTLPEHDCDCFVMAEDGLIWEAKYQSNTRKFHTLITSRVFPGVTKYKEKHDMEASSVTDCIRVFVADTEEYKRLELASAIINHFTHIHSMPSVVYFDINQEWRWTTLVADAGKDSKITGYTMLSPMEQLSVLYGDHEEFSIVVNNVISRVTERGW